MKGQPLYPLPRQLSIHLVEELAVLEMEKLKTMLMEAGVVVEEEGVAELQEQHNQLFPMMKPWLVVGLGALLRGVLCENGWRFRSLTNKIVDSRPEQTK